MPRLPRALKVEIADEDLELSLRMLQHSDDQSLADAVNEDKSHLSEYLDWAEGKYGLVEANQFIAEVRQEWRDKTGFGFGIFDEHRLAGHIMISNIDLSKKKDRDEEGAKVEYWVSKPYSRQGIATAALTRMVEFAFEDLELPSLKLVTRSVNHGANRVAEKSGFSKVRDFREARLKYNEYVITNDRPTDS